RNPCKSGGEPPQVAGERLRVEPSGSVLLTCREHGHVDVAYAHLEDEVASPQRLSARYLFTRAQDDATGLFHGPEQQVCAEPLPTGLVALRSEDTFGLSVEARDVGERPSRCEIVDDEDGILGSEGERFERIAGARPVPREVQSVEARAVVCLAARGELRFEET